MEKITVVIQSLADLDDKAMAFEKNILVRQCFIEGAKWARDLMKQDIQTRENEFAKGLIKWWLEIDGDELVEKYRESLKQKEDGKD